MSYPFNYPNPSNADIQIFSGSYAGTTTLPVFSWVKPSGVSFVWFTLIGQGGNGGVGNGTAFGGGGGSGSVTNCLMPAFLVPDILSVLTPDPARSVANTQIRYKTKNSTYILLEAENGSAGAAATVGTGGVASTRTNFACAGLFQSTEGQDGFYNAGSSASTSIFLGGGSGTNSTTTTMTANYGYSETGSGARAMPGYFQINPIIVGRGSCINADTLYTKTELRSGVGCGGAGVQSGSGPEQYGGPGMAIIISW